MTKTRPALSGDIYHQQFHNLEHHDLGEHTRPMWYELEEQNQPQQEFARGGAPHVAAPRPSHPLHGISGVHIITADAGEPIFHGEL